MHRFRANFLEGVATKRFSVKKRFFSERGEAIQWIRGLVRISTGKVIQWGGSGHSLNRRILKTEVQQRGGNSGEGKTYHKAPPQKPFWTPPPTYDTFPPPFVHAMSFSLAETGTDQTNPIFWGLQKWFWRGHFIVRFPPPPQIAPYVSPPPPFANSQWCILLPP